LASDHAGFNLKNHLRDVLRQEGHDVTDHGTNSPESNRLPRLGRARRQSGHVARDSELGVLVCGTGVGVSIAANKIRGVRSARRHLEPVSARFARSHNDANIVCMGERIIGDEVASEIVHTFLNTPFSHGERHQRRIDKVTKMETDQGACG